MTTVTAAKPDATPRAAGVPNDLEAFWLPFDATFERFLERNDGKVLFPQLHQNDIDCHAMQPCGKRRFPAKRPDLAK